MEEFDVKGYFKILIKNWKLIALFVAVTFIVSSVYNFTTKKTPVPFYKVEATIDVTAVVFNDKTTPSIVLDKETEEKLYDQAAKDIKINPLGYSIITDISKGNNLKLTITSLKSEGLEQYANQILQNWIERYKTKNISDIDQQISLLATDTKKNIYDINGELSVILIQNEMKSLNNGETELKEKINTYKTDIEKNQYNMELTKFMLSKTKERVDSAVGIARDESIKRYVSLQSNIDSYEFNVSYYSGRLLKAKDDLKQTIKEKPIYTLIYNGINNNEKLNSKIIFNQSKVNRVIAMDTRVRSIIVSVFLVFVLMCCFVFGKEYFMSANKKITEKSI